MRVRQFDTTSSLHLAKCLKLGTSDRAGPPDGRPPPSKQGFGSCSHGRLVGGALPLLPRPVRSAPGVTTLPPLPASARLLLLALARPHRGARLEGVEKALGARGDIQHGLLEGRGVRRRRLPEAAHLAY